VFYHRVFDDYFSAFDSPRKSVTDAIDSTVKFLEQRKTRLAKYRNAPNEADLEKLSAKALIALMRTPNAESRLSANKILKRRLTDAKKAADVKPVSPAKAADFGKLVEAMRQAEVIPGVSPRYWYRDWLALKLILQPNLDAVIDQVTQAIYKHPAVLATQKGVEFWVDRTQTAINEFLADQVTSFFAPGARLSDAKESPKKKPCEDYLKSQAVNGQAFPEVQRCEFVRSNSIFSDPIVKLTFDSVVTISGKEIDIIVESTKSEFSFSLPQWGSPLVTTSFSNEFLSGSEQVMAGPLANDGSLEKVTLQINGGYCNLWSKRCWVDVVGYRDRKESLRDILIKRFSEQFPEWESVKVVVSKIPDERGLPLRIERSKRVAQANQHEGK
jgi:hypothetical protein